jgi:hypothetical protein
MTTKAKATTKKAAAKKAPAKKVVVKPQADVAIEALQLTKQEQNLVSGVLKNQEKIHSSANSMIKLAIDSGNKLLSLKDTIQSKYGRAWKAWCEAHSVEMGLNYRQIAKYMLVAQNQTLALEGDYTSINDACEAIGREKRPEAAEARDEEKAQKRAQAKVTGGEISERVLNEIDECTNIESLRGLIALITDRIEYLSGEGAKAGPVDDDDDVLEGDYSVDDDAADIEDIIG